MIPNYVVIPYRGKLEMTRDIAREIRAQGETEAIILLNNGRPYDIVGVAGIEFQCEDWNLHKMFNYGISWANAYDAGTGCTNIGIFNNDITIGEHFVSRLAAGLRSDEKIGAVCGSGDYADEDPTVRRVRSGDRFEGPTMMLRGELPFHFDEQFEWWCGDTDMAAQIESAGYILGQVPNAHFTHIDGGSVSVKEFAGEIDYWNGCNRDVERFHAKWPQIPRGSHSIPIDLLPKGDTT